MSQSAIGMSGSRARTSNSVSLFPFLAVLVCAMGALIFLLIVTTRRIRSEALAKAALAREEKEARGSAPTPTALRPELPPPMPAELLQPLPNVVGPIPANEPERIEPIPGVVVLGPSQSEPVLQKRQIVLPEEPEPIWPAAIAQKPPRNNPNIKLREEFKKLKSAKDAWLNLVSKKEKARTSSNKRSAD